MARDARVTSKIMSAVKNRDTHPERTLRTALWRRGMRYRLRSKLPGRPDIVFPGAKVVVFVDGDFWHGNAWRARNMPDFESQFTNIANAGFWRTKVRANMIRDAEVNRSLVDAGWAVYRVFESRLNKEIDLVVEEIGALVRQRRAMPAGRSGRSDNGRADAEID